MEMKYRQLVINPGSTSTKIAIYDNEKLILEEKLHHEIEKLKRFTRVIDQYEYRRDLILDSLHQHGINLTKLNAVIARGGLLRPIAGGTYTINDKMVDHLKEAKYGEHASNLGAIIAYEIANRFNISSYIVDPVVVDELEPIARYSGWKGINRKSIFHALNQKSVARKVAKQIGVSYNTANFIVCHMGGGITVGAHIQGRVIDVNNGLDGEGPFSPERAGGLPVGDLVKLCFSGRFREDEVKKKLVGEGGLASYLNTNNALQIEEMIEQGNENAGKIYSAMAYQIGKEIGAYSVVAKGKIDSIILTGGLAYSEKLVTQIRDYIKWIAPVYIEPGENELKALSEGGLRVLRQEEVAKEYD